jgi:hypothetical protein
VFGSSGSGSRTDFDFLAVPGAVLMDLFPRVRFSGTWTDPGTTLLIVIVLMQRFPNLLKTAIDNIKIYFVGCNCVKKYW